MNIERLRALNEARTKMVWNIRYGYQGGTSGQFPTGLGPACSMDAFGEDQAEKDAAFIATAANHFSALLDVVEAAEKLKERLFPVYLELRQKGEIPEEWAPMWDALAKLEAIE